LPQHQDGRIAGARFEVGEVTLGHTRLPRQRASRHASASPAQAHRFAERREKGVFAVVRLDRVLERHRRGIQRRKTAL
jgi:hypothetical protein